MRTLPLALLLLASPGIAAKKGPAKKEPQKKAVTMKKLVEVAMAKGESWTLPDPRASKLGYTGPQAAKDFVVGDTSKDTQFSSVIILDADGKTPASIVFSSTSVTAWSGENPAAIEGRIYRSDLSGNLVSAMHTHGAADDVIQDVVTIDDTVKAQFEAFKKSLLAMPSLK